MDSRLAEKKTMNTLGFDHIIVGAGLAGGVLARKLAEERGERVLVLDRRKHIGGNAYDYTNDKGIRVQKYGPHVFHSNSDKAYGFILQYCTAIPYRTRCEAVLDGISTPSPFNFKTIDQFYPDEKAAELKSKLLEAYPGREEVTVLEMLQAEDEDIRQHAELLFEKDYRPYTAKQWALQPSEIDPSVLKRVPIVLSYRDTYFGDKYEFMPKGGFEAFFECLLDHPNIAVQLDIDALEHLTVASGQNVFLFDGKETEIIYTGAIDELFGYRFGVLPYRSLQFEFESMQIKSFQRAAIVAYPQEEGYTRITEYTKMPEQDGNGWTSVAYEYPVKYENKENEPYYPVLTEKSQQVYQKYAAYAKNFRNLVLCGRLADYKYYNMDQIILRAMEVFRAIGE